MNAETRQPLLDALDHCRRARQRLGAQGAQRTRILLDMTTHALSRELALLDVGSTAVATGAPRTTG